jgi:hypothetical protein
MQPGRGGPVTGALAEVLAPRQVLVVLESNGVLEGLPVGGRVTKPQL